MKFCEMQRSGWRTRWCDRDCAAIAAALSLALVLVGCSSGVLGGPAAPAADSSSRSFFGSERMPGFFSTSSAKTPQRVAGAQPEVSCPPVEIREGAGTLSIGPPGENTTMSLKYQGTFVRTARECQVVDGNMVMKIGVQGRVVVGPAGGPGQIEVPLRIAVVWEKPGDSTPITTKFIRIPVTIATDLRDAPFTHVEEGLSFPLPTPTTALDDYVAYIGFDPLAAAAQDKQTAPKTKPRRKAKPPAGSS